jgi:hypothetical protein
MFNHQYDFDIEIPKEVITDKKHDHIFEENLENKSIIGLCGYGKSGKDYIAKTFIDKYHYHRVAFADNIKIEMNEHLREIVFDFLGQYNGVYTIDQGESNQDIHGGHNLDDGRRMNLDMVDFLTEDQPLKRRLRPFIIWYGEKLREINGPYYWINQAFKLDAAGHDKIILSDVRRIAELEVFDNSNSFYKRSRYLFGAAGCLDMTPESPGKSYNTLLFHVTQLGLTDKDTLTHDCIRVAQENWMFNSTIMVDPRLPEKGDFRAKAMDFQINRIVENCGIETPDKTVAWDRQKKLF